MFLALESNTKIYYHWPHTLNKAFMYLFTLTSQQFETLSEMKGNAGNPFSVVPLKYQSIVILMWWRLLFHCNLSNTVKYVSKWWILEERTREERRRSSEDVSPFSFSSVSVQNYYIGALGASS